MKMSNRLSLEHALYILIILLALTLRLLNLGAAPLAEGESVLALKALDLAKGERVALEPQPGYVALTGATFALFGSSEFTARWWPALVGGLLSLVPFSSGALRQERLIPAWGWPRSRLVALAGGWPMLAVGLRSWRWGWLIMDSFLAGAAGLASSQVRPAAGLAALALAQVDTCEEQWESPRLMPDGIPCAGILLRRWQRSPWRGRSSCARLKA
jgi:hypothetical protein